MKSLQDFATNYAAIKQSLGNHVKLVAVTKGQPASTIQTGFDLGLREFGENYVQEFLQKWEQLRALTINWHFIGRLQKNKVRHIIDKIDWLHSLDSMGLAEEIQRRAPHPIQCLLQVNLGREATKSGLDISDCEKFLAQVLPLNKIVIKGLMVLPPFSDDPTQTRPHFEQLKDLRDQLNTKKTYSTPLTELSMGMSTDYLEAIHCGATMVRIGTALFGTRSFSA